MHENQPRPKIPVFEKEVMAAEAKRFGGDYDKVSSTSFGCVEWLGVTVRSRYADASEMELMLDMVAALTADERSQIFEIFCDSKRGNDFLVQMSIWDPTSVRAIGNKLDRLACERSHGHSGIMLRQGDMFGGGPSIEIEPDFGD